MLSTRAAAVPCTSIQITRGVPSSMMLLVLVLSHIIGDSGPASSEPIPSTGSNIPGVSWSLRQSIPNQMVLTYIDEQMRNLKYSCDSNMDQLMRKLESLDTKIARFDTSSLLRLEKLSETVHLKEIKDELALEQLTRKIDSNYERLNHKLTFVENRLESTFNKMQVNVESGINRLESRQGDIESEISDISNSVDEIKSLSSFIDDKHNSTQRTVHEQLQAIMSESASRQQLEKLSTYIQDVGNKLNDSTTPGANSQNDGIIQLGPETEKTIIGIGAQISNESKRIENKMSNMYNDLWRRFMSLESTVKSVLTLGNTTRRQLQDDFRSIIQQEKRYMEQDSQENFVEIALDALTNIIKELKELSRKLDTNFQMVITTQNLFMESYHRVQNDGLDELESKVSLVLEKIISTVTNKTTRIDSRLVEVMEMIKSHQTQVMRNLGHVTKMIISLSEDGKQGTKQFEVGMFELAERNEVLALGIQELYEELQSMINITNCQVSNETTPPSLDETPSNQNESSHEKLGSQAKTSIKFADTDEVVKIFTEDGEAREPLNAPTTEERKSNSGTSNNTRKLSIVLPYTFNETSNIYKTIIELLNKSSSTDNAEAIILNTQEERQHNLQSDKPIANVPQFNKSSLQLDSTTRDRQEDPNFNKSTDLKATSINVRVGSELTSTAPSSENPQKKIPDPKIDTPSTFNSSENLKPTPLSSLGKISGFRSRISSSPMSNQNGSFLQNLSTQIKKPDREYNFKKSYEEYKNNKLRQLARVKLNMETPSQNLDDTFTTASEKQKGDFVLPNNDPELFQYESNDNLRTDTSNNDELPSLENSAVDSIDWDTTAW